MLLKDEFNGKPASFGLAEDVISKYMRLVGGTGNSTQYIQQSQCWNIFKEILADNFYDDMLLDEEYFEYIKEEKIREELKTSASAKIQQKQKEFQSEATKINTYV